LSRDAAEYIEGWVCDPVANHHLSHRQHTMAELPTVASEFDHVPNHSREPASSDALGIWIALIERHIQGRVANS